jgi:erythromycin esterase
MTNTVNLAAWVREHAITADTLDPRAPLDDLEPVRALVGDARVVAIGESAHHIEEFYDLRHRLLRFLVERCGFTVYAFETPVLESRAMDAWVRGGPGTVENAAATTGTGLASCQAMYRTLEWMRTHNRDAARPVRFAGVLAGTGGVSPVGELNEVAAYLHQHDPDALPLIDRAAAIAATYLDRSIVNTLSAYTALDPSERDALTAALGRLRSRMDSMTGLQRDRGHLTEHLEAVTHLRRALYLDDFTRDLTGSGLASGTTSLDAAMAETVLHLLGANGPGTKILLGLHNVHLRKTPATGDGPAGRFPAGYHLAQALGHDYLAIAATSSRGHTVRGQLDPGQADGFTFTDLPLPTPPGDSIETAFTTNAPLTIADLRTARTGTADIATFTKLRMEDYFTDTPVLNDFDAIAHIPQTTATEYPTNHPEPDTIE